MPYHVAAKNLMLNHLRQAISHVSLHSGPPIAGNELSGDVYARVKVEFGDALSGVIELQGKAIFAAPAGAKVTHAGFWTSGKGGVLLASGPTKEASFDKRGVYVVDTAKLDLNAEIGRAHV